MTRKSDRIPIEPEPELPLIDCHCHFPLKHPPKGMPLSYEKQYNEFFDKNGQLIITSTDYYEYKNTAEFVNKHDKILMTYGWGPQTVTYSQKEKHDLDFQKFLEFCQKHSDEFVCIGEIGLDFHHARTLAERERQINVFEKIIKETKHLEKPYSLHVRNAGPRDTDPNNPKDPYNEPDRVNNIILEILEDENILPSQVMWHCFSGPANWGPYLAEQGYYISVPASAFGFRKWRRNFKGVDISHLLTETDSAWQHPFKMGAFNMPINVKYAICAIAYLNRSSQQEIAQQILANASIFFDLDLN
ncbi:TatD family hydrolase [Candidatus Harpocratesius sp.]